jgi:catalase
MKSNPPTRDEEVIFDKLEGWDGEKIKEKIEEAKGFGRNRHLA